MKSLYQRYSSHNLHYSTKSTSLNQARAALNQSIDYVLICCYHPPPQWKVLRRVASVNQTRPFFPPPQRKMEKVVWLHETIKSQSVAQLAMWCSSNRIGRDSGSTSGYPVAQLDVRLCNWPGYTSVQNIYVSIK